MKNPGHSTGVLNLVREGGFEPPRLSQFAPVQHYIKQDHLRGTNLTPAEPQFPDTF